MRLRDLDAQFIAGIEARRGAYRDQESIEGAQGVMFQCPKCGEGRERGFEDGRGHIKGAHYIRVCFANPRGVPVAPPEFDKNPRWSMVGSSLDDLTTKPSINCDVGPNSACTFHGFITKGEVTW